MSIRLREIVADGGHEKLSRRDQFRLLPVKEYWRESVNPETGEPFLDESGDPVLVPVDEITAKQSFKDQTDINRILERHSIKNVNAHIVKYPPEVYHEFQNIDLLQAYGQIERINEIFADLPSEVRNEFGNNPMAFAAYASNPQNNDRLGELLPAIAEPGSYFPNPHKRGGQGAAAATAPIEPPAGSGTAEPSPPEGASGGSSAAPTSSST